MQLLYNIMRLFHYTKNEYVLMHGVCLSLRLPGHGRHLFANIGKFGLSYFLEFATDFPETLQVN